MSLRLGLSVPWQEDTLECEFFFCLPGFCIFGFLGMFLRLNWLSGGICGRLEAYIGYKGDIKSKVVQLELFHRNLGRSHIMELLENEKSKH